LILIALTSAALADVTITSKKQTYRRPKPIADHKKTFTITWPKVKAASPALSRKIEAALSYEKAFDFTVREELREVQWLETAEYNVVYNKGNILCVSLFIEGSGAYPSGSTKYVVVDTRTGVKQTSGMVFTDLSGLVAMIRKDQEKEVAEAIVEIRKDPELREPDPSTMFTDKKFTTADLKHFSVDASGVTFHYEYGFPHVIQALAPVGEFRYSWSQIKPYIKKGGLLAPMAR
jgi:hypothetical protein